MSMDECQPSVLEMKVRVVNGCMPIGHFPEFKHVTVIQALEKSVKRVQSDIHWFSSMTAQE